MRALTLALLTCLVAAAPASARVRCDRRAGSTLVADASFRVYVTTQPDKHDPDANTMRIYSCRAGTLKRSRRIDKFHNNLDGELTPESGRLAGHWALVEFDAETGVTDGHSLVAYDLRNGKQSAALYVDGSDVLDAVLTTRGAYAVNLPDRGLLGFDAAGQRTLAPAATDLAARGSRVYWMAAGVPATAVLGAAPTKDVDLE